MEIMNLKENKKSHDLVSMQLLGEDIIDSWSVAYKKASDIEKNVQILKDLQPKSIPYHKKYANCIN